MFKTLNHIIDSTNIERIKFRHDVNGLRAIAVLSVLIYHAELKIFTAGYLGVDIFFVLSGYLITNIIISDLNSNNFSFKSFYLRRIKRILPALFSVLIITSVFSYLLLTPKMLLEYVKSLIPSTFFYSNIYFSNLDFYNSEPARHMPLIHTWSLAIEEQFYIIFPLFLYIAYKYFKKYIFYIFIFIIFMSIYLNTSTDSLDKFYLIQYRSWELILGSVITIFDNKLPKNKYIAYIGSIIMFFPILFFNDFWITDIEPKLISLLGVSLILIFNTEQNLLNNILSSKVLKKTGLWSYSIYLLHQPIFVFFRLFEDKNLPISWKSVEKEINLDNYILFLLLTLLIIFLSKLNYEFVEASFKAQLNNLKIIFILITILLIPFFTFTTIKFNGYENNWSSNVLTQKALNFQKKDNYDLILNGDKCHITVMQESKSNFCKTNLNSPNREIIVLGDSMSRTIITSLSENFSNNPITFITGDSCIFLVEVVNERCVRSDTEYVTNLLTEFEGKIIIYIVDLWQKVENNPNQLENIKMLDLTRTFPDTINHLSKKNKVILLTQIPTYRPNVPELILSGKDVVKIKSEEWRNLDGVKILNSLYINLNEQNLYLINIEKIFCDSYEIGYCVANTKNNLFYSDSKHLSIEGAELVTFEIIKVLESLNS